MKRLSLQLDASTDSLNQLRRDLESQRHSLEQRASRLLSEKAALQTELSSERSLSQQAILNMESYQKLIKQKDNEIEELEEQIKDLLTHFETKEKFQSHCSTNLAELEGGTIFIGNSSQNNAVRGKVHHRRKK